MTHTKGIPNVFVTSCVAIIMAVGCGPAAHDVGCGAAPTEGTMYNKGQSQVAAAISSGISPTGGGTDQDRLSKLARTINDNPDRFHSDATPSVQALVCEGKNAIPLMLDLMTSADVMTRWRAQVVLKELTFKMYDSERPQWEIFWRNMGDLDYTAGNENRLASVSNWRKWLASGCPGCPAPNARRSQGLY